MTEEPMNTETVDICACGRVMHQLEVDDYNTLGADSCTCCPDCGNEKFQTIAQLQAELDKKNEASKPDNSDECHPDCPHQLKKHRCYGCNEAEPGAGFCEVETCLGAYPEYCPMSSDECEWTEVA